MSFNINEFKSQGLVYGGARPALFRVVFSAPQISGLNLQAVGSLSFKCRAAELPASTVAAVEVPYFGRKIKVAGDRTFADWQVTMMNDEDFSARTLFEAWSNGLNRLVSNVRDPGATNESKGIGSYKVDMQVQQFGKDGEIIRGYNIVGAFPTEIGAIALDWDNQNQIETFPVTFAYDYWEPVSAASSKIGAGKSFYNSTSPGRNPN